MGQKVHPYGFRLGYNKNWQSRWFSKKTTLPLCMKTTKSASM